MYWVSNSREFRSVRKGSLCLSCYHYYHHCYYCVHESNTSVLWHLARLGALFCPRRGTESCCLLCTDSGLGTRDKWSTYGVRRSIIHSFSFTTNTHVASSRWLGCRERTDMKPSTIALVTSNFPSSCPRIINGSRWGLYPRGMEYSSLLFSPSLARIYRQAEWWMIWQRSTASHKHRPLFLNAMETYSRTLRCLSRAILVNPARKKDQQGSVWHGHLCVNMWQWHDTATSYL